MGEGGLRGWLAAVAALTGMLAAAQPAMAQDPARPNVVIVFVDKARFITSGAYRLGEPRVEHERPLLFDLAADPGEHYDVAADHADVVAELTELAERQRRAVPPAEPLFDALLP